jgi:ketosteroid isomerase-like protein
MTITCPEPIAAYYAAEQANDFEALARCFAADARVLDEGRTIAGGAEIAAWMADAKRRYQHRTEVLSVRERDGAYVVSARVTGQFPNSPVTLEQTFRLAEGAIQAVEIH